MSQVGNSIAELLSGASVVFVGIVVNRAVALIAQILITRSLSPSEFGLVALAFTIVASLGEILVLGAPQGVTRLIAADPTDRRACEFLQSGLLISIFGGGTGAIAVYILRFKIQQILSSVQLAPLLSIFALFVFVFRLW